MNVIENRTFDEIGAGESASLTRTLTAEDLQLVAAVSGDVDPAHVEIWGAALIAAVLAIRLSQQLHFRHPIGLGDTLTATVTATAKNLATHRVSFGCRCVNQAGVVVVDGSAEMIAGSMKVRRSRGGGVRAASPGDRAARHRDLLASAQNLVPLRTAVVHPVDRNSLLGAIEAARAGLIVPVLVGPEPKIRAVAAAEGVDLAPYRLVATRHSHEAAERAVAMARAGEVEALMKGSLHTDELMHEVVAKETGLRTARRITHIFVMDVPTCPRPLFITDAAVNIAPDLMTKRDIVQNAIDLAQVLGVAVPKVAILSAVETPTPEIASTIDESGNMLAKQLEYLGEAQAAGIVLGARAPIVLTSRADSPATRMASCAVALVFARRGPKY